MPISMMRPVWLHSIETGKRTVQHTYGDDGLNEQQRQRQQQRQRRPTVTPHEEYPDLASAAERRQRRRLMMAERGRRSFLRAGLLQPRDADASTEAPASQRETTTAARAGATNAAAAANDTAAADSPVAGEVRTVVSVLRSLRNCCGGEACQLEARSRCYCCGCDKAMALS